MTDDLNPFASPMVTESLPIPAAAEDTRAEVIRREHLKHEASVKSIGLLYYLGGGIVVLGTYSATVEFFVVRAQRAQAPPMFLFLFASYAVLGPVLLAVGYGLRRFQSWVKWPVGLLAALGSLGILMGTLNSLARGLLTPANLFLSLITAAINAYILHVVFCKKGKMVLSPEYQEIVRQTPHIEYRMPLIARIVLALFLVALAVGVPWLFCG